MPDFIDKAKDLAKDLTEKAREAVTDHADTIEGGIDKAAKFVDEKTKGKYADKIETVQAKAHEAVEKLAAGKEKGGKDGKGDGGAADEPDADEAAG
jgi:hypothetical protein